MRFSFYVSAFSEYHIETLFPCFILSSKLSCLRYSKVILRNKPNTGIKLFASICIYIYRVVFVVVFCIIQA